MSNRLFNFAHAYYFELNKRLQMSPFIELDVTFNVVDSYGNLLFEYQRKEDGTIDLSSIKQFFNIKDYEEGIINNDNIFDMNVNDSGIRLIVLNKPEE